jgi:hypothetical protein
MSSPNRDVFPTVQHDNKTNNNNRQLYVVAYNRVICSAPWYPLKQCRHSPMLAIYRSNIVLFHHVHVPFTHTFGLGKQVPGTSTSVMS